MEWYEIHVFGKRLEIIEQFFVEIAANEELLVLNGFSGALTLPSAEKAIEELTTFNTDFSTLKRYVDGMDHSLSEELARIEGEGNLIDQVSLISLRLRMAAARKPLSSSISIASRAISLIPFFSRSVATKPLFGHENISIQKTIINLGRLRGVADTFVKIVRQKEISDDEVFKPSNIIPSRVVTFIDRALVEIDELTFLSPTERKRIEGYLQEAKKEALSDSPSWSKIIGALVIVAAITSGLADAPGAAKTVKDAIEYILGTSVEKPLQKFLPPPEPDEHQALSQKIA